MSRSRILQIFSRYQHYGGEEGSVYRIGDVLQESYEVEYFIKSTANLLAGSAFDKLMVPWSVLHNTDTVRQLRRLQELGRFDLWLVHNVVPALSPSVYEEAFRTGVPIIHYLHNYRFFCANGFFLDHGTPCEKCAGGNYLHALKAACWRESHLMSGWMGVVLTRMRIMDIANRVARWIAISQAQKDVYTRLGFPADRIDVIHHFFQPKNPPVPAPKDGYALFLGRLSPEKGLLSLLTAWKKMPAGRKLVIAGEGPELEKIKQFANEGGLTNVEILGFVPPEGQQALWAGAAFLVVPSIWMEPFGMVVLEAWSRGRTVVAYSLGALPELIVQEKNGLLVTPHNTDDLAAAMERLFQDGELCRFMAQEGIMEIKTRFSKDRWLKQIQATIATVVP